MNTPFLLFTQSAAPTHHEITPTHHKYNQLVPFTQSEIEHAKDQGQHFGHLFEESPDEFLMNRKFIYISSLIL